MPPAGSILSLSALALVLAGALMHALWNLQAKQVAGGLPFVWLYGAVSLAFATPFGVIAAGQQLGSVDATIWLAIVASAIVHVAYSLVLQQAYRVADFSVVYPLARGTGPLFAVVGAILLLGERPSTAGWCAIALIVVGIVLVSGLVGRLGAQLSTLRAGFLWGLATGLTIAAYTVIDGWAMASQTVSPVLYYVVGLLLRTALLAPPAFLRRRELLAQWRAHRRAVIVVGVLSPLAYLLVLEAMTRAPLSYVAPVRELSMLLGVALGAGVLRERLTPARSVGTLCMLSGVAMLAIAG